MRIIQHESVSQLALPPDFAAFLNEIPAGFDFNLWNLQGAMRFTREGVSAAQTFERELKSAQELGLIRETAEDRAFTDRCRNEYGSGLRYGATYIKEAVLN
jgi:hypothetical protein